MKIAIIGGGFTGLSAAYELAKAGHQVTLFEKEKTLGGLAASFKRPGWDWYLEGAYHHWFTNDKEMLCLIDELGLTNKLIVKRPITASLYKGRPYQLDSPLHLLTFPGLSLMDKLRTAALLVFLKLTPFWQPLENLTASELLLSLGGKRAYRLLWEPLLFGKFGKLAPTVSAAWFWARIKKRTPRLMYMEGGFHTLVKALESAITKNGGKIYTGMKIDSIRYESGEKPQFSILNSHFHAILLTIPTTVAVKLFPNLAFGIGHLALKVPHLHAQTLILETKEPILKDIYPDKIGAYWLNITDRSFPFLAVVAHTNFMDRKHYGGHHLTYFGNYLPDGHPYLSLTKDQLLQKFLPFIKRLTHNSQFTILNSVLFTGPFAQPVHQLHYSRLAPPLKTPIKGIYLANLDSIYPWDRGTNYAVELGKQAARAIIKSDR